MSESTSLSTVEPVDRGNSILKTLRKEQALPLWLSVIAGLISTFFLIIAWWQIAVIVNEVISANSYSDIKSVLLSQGSVAIPLSLMLRAFFLFLQERLAQHASARIRDGVRQRILSNWLVAPYERLSKHSPSSHAGRLLEDVDALDGYFSRYWPQQQLMLLSPLLILLAIVNVNWLIALLMLISAPLIPLFMSLIGMGAEQLNQRHVKQRQRLAGHFFDRLQKLATIKRLQAEEQVATELSKRSDDYRRIVMKTLRLAFLSSAVLEFFSSVAIAAVAIYIGFSLFGAISFGPAQFLTLGSGLFILALAPEFFQPLRQFAQSYHDKAAALAAADQLSELLLMPTNESSINIVNIEDEQTLLKTVGLIVKSGDNKLVISDLNLDVGVGQLLLICGASGVGKTTLLKTLCQLLPPAMGSVFWSQGLSNHAFYLAQQPWIVRGSIRENLKLLGSQASDQVLLKVLHELGLDGLCATVQDLDKFLSERGEGVSGGQLQRIALARAFLLPYKLIFLDEPTASLDNLSRKHIIEALKLLKFHSSIVVVSHDIELIDLADNKIQLGSSEQCS